MVIDKTGLYELNNGKKVFISRIEQGRFQPHIAYGVVEGEVEIKQWDLNGCVENAENVKKLLTSL